MEPAALTCAPRTPTRRYSRASGATSWESSGSGYTTTSFISAATRCSRPRSCRAQTPHSAWNWVCASCSRTPRLPAWRVHIEAAMSKGDRAPADRSCAWKSGELAHSRSLRSGCGSSISWNRAAAHTTFPSAVRLAGRLDVEALEQAFGEIVRRHEALRTTFSVVDEQPTQVIEDAAPVRLRRVDLSALSEARSGGAKQASLEPGGARPFDLSHGAIAARHVDPAGRRRARGVPDGSPRAWDGWSLGVLVKELSALYQTFSEGRPSPMPELPVQYADYAAWQRKWLGGDRWRLNSRTGETAWNGAPTSLN